MRRIAFTLLVFIIVIFSYGMNNFKTDHNIGYIDFNKEKANKPLPLEEGDYRGIWTSKTKDKAFDNLKITARIKKVVGGGYTGSLFISSKFKSCCKTLGDNGDGRINFTIIDNKIILTWFSKIPICEGIFSATGTYSETNKMKLILVGSDCDGEHT